MGCSKEPAFSGKFDLFVKNQYLTATKWLEQTMSCTFISGFASRGLNNFPDFKINDAIPFSFGFPVGICKPLIIFC